MKLHNHFSPKDMYQASKEYWCAIDVLTMILTDVQEGNVDAAKNKSIDLTKSLHELTKLSERKYNQDHLNSLINQLVQEGNAIQIVRKLKHE